MERPYTFFIGPRKTGTTAFYNILKEQRVQITSRVKETFFFEAEQIDISEYKRNYGINPNEPFVEISPSYFTKLNALSNIQQLFPEARIVISLRDPVLRAMSAMRHTRRIGLIKQSDTLSDLAVNKHIANIIDGSNYEKHIALWAKTFPKNVLQIKQQSDATYGNEAIAALNDFLNLNINVEHAKKHRANQATAARSESMVALARGVHRKLQDKKAFGVIKIFKPFKPLLFTSNAKKKDSDFDDVMQEFFSKELQDSISYYEKAPIVKLL